MTQTLQDKQIPRPPIIVVVGHIDHGKTTLLDWYRKTKVADKESGSITQRIAAYEVEHAGKRLTFIDTPGHESFSKIRQRGARLADVAILVVAADDGVKPQTREAIKVLKEANLSFAVAINKIDKPDANPERLKQELAKEEVLVESYGGTVPAVETSGRTGQGLDELLETLLLLGEMQELTSDPDMPGEGIVIETERDPRRGTTATLIVQSGTLHKGDTIVVGRSAEPVRILENFAGRPADMLGPSSPGRVAGLGKVPTVGDTFHAYSSRGDAEAAVRALPPEVAANIVSRTLGADEHTDRVFSIILKSDVFGSQEALADALLRLSSPAVAIRLLSAGVGDINESDIKLALATRLVTIVGFRVRVDTAAQGLARAQNIRVVTGTVIYDLLDQVKATITDLIPPEVTRIDLGRVKVLKIFKKDQGKQVVGGRVEAGKIVKGAQVEIVRMKSAIGTGTIAGLQRGPQQTEEVSEGTECGMAIESRTTIEEIDELAVYQTETKKIDFYGDPAADRKN
ncbi:MAG: translation initiation factor IF-2 [Candidatus Sungbacteria bacterium RIFCSPHIGHO2_02_FULL_53_17]|uniref:Translation initiation factor IF-2 n=1 Tax=Candidatus Sungbacteria bacterium RIFCSPHIGHO2_02_FULL_53_17 TaxID=1802275 RepID=A0A1G2KVU2_9BACT|nr:MAG: translation initiation factor IF-2 [Candidatus Sungbacteria bacterium RIFCSPHIGHO2_02_FULL_53_17]